MKKVYVLPYSEVLNDSDFTSGAIKGISVIYKKNYYPFMQLGKVFTFQHGFFSLDEDALKEKRKELQESNDKNVLSDRKVKANKLIFEIENAIDGLVSDSKTRIDLINTLLSCKNYISYYSE
mgnify:FL=1